MSDQGKVDGDGEAAFDIGAVVGSLSQDNRTVMERKGWLKDGKPIEGFNLDKVVDSYRGLESLQGKKTLEEPNIADPETFAKWPGHQLLGGVPDKIEGYEFGERPPLPEGLKWSEKEGDGGIAWDAEGEKMLRTAMLKGKIYPWQAKAMMNEIVQERVGMIARAHAASATEGATVKANLQTAYGAGLDGAMQSGKQAMSFIAEKAGIDAVQAIDQLASLMGNEAAVKFSIQLGKMLGEDSLKGGKAAGFATGPDAARAQIADFKSDPDKVKALLEKDNPRHAQVNAEWQRLNKLVRPAS